MEKIIIKSYEDYDNDEREIGDDPIYDSPFITNAWNDDNPFSPEALVDQYKSAGYTFNTDNITVYKILGKDIYAMYEDGDDIIYWDRDVPYIKNDTIFYVLRSDELCEMNPPCTLAPSMKFKLIKSTSALTVNTLDLSASKVTAPVPLFLITKFLFNALPLITSV